jgi:hypothetical protein
MELEQRVLLLEEHKESLYQHVKSVKEHVKLLEHEVDTYADTASVQCKWDTVLPHLTLYSSQ